LLAVGSGTNDMLREELCQLQQPQAHQEDTNNNTSTEEVCWISDGEPTEEQIRFLSVYSLGPWPAVNL